MLQPTLSDQDIIEKLRVGETHVFKYCYPKAYPQVKGMVLKNGGNSTDAEDVFQEALIVFYRNSIKPDFILTSALSTYIYAVAYRLWMKVLRDRKKNVPLDELHLEMVDEFDFTLPSEKSDQLGDVISAMEAAGKRCKEILITFYFNKLKYDQIAAKLGMKDERAVREQKYRCMKRIKEALKT